MTKTANLPKKVASLLLALIMAFAMSVHIPASTAYGDDTCTITINNETSGYKYTAYQIFDGDLSGSGTGTDPYVLSNIIWGAAITDGDSALAKVKAITFDEGSTPFSSCASAADIAAVLDESQDDSEIAQAFAEIISSYVSGGTESDSGTYSSSEKTYAYKISGLDAGYYLVKTTTVPSGGTTTGDGAYTRYILTVTGNEAINTKSDVPTVEKKVYEEDYDSTPTEIDDYGEGYNDVADYGIGDAVQFELIGTMPSNLADYSAYKYIFHDTMDAGLTFDNTSIAVTVSTGETTPITIPDTYGTTTNYTVVTNTSDGCTFEVQFADVLSLIDSSGNAVTVDSSSKIVATFKATLNSSAVIGLDGNENEVYLEYSNDPNAGGESVTGKTPVDKVIVFTYELDVTKTDGNDTKLKDAEFKLYKEDGSTKYYAKVDNSTGEITWVDVEANATTFSSDDDGFFKIVGLDDGTYYLKETKAPSGYNLLEDPIELVIAATTANGQNWSGDPSEALTKLTISVDGEGAISGNINDGTVATTVDNNAGTTLPTTGGIGTTIFYIVGGVLVVGAAVLLITRRRMKKE